MEFREYKIKDILLIEQIQNKFKDTKEVELQPLGEYPVITQGTGERYIQKYINTYRENGNVITYSFCGETWATYQPLKFSGVGSKIGKITIKNKMLTENLALYLVSCINNLSGSARAFQQVPDKLGNNFISLPSIIHDDGTFEPDWDYMENYIKELKEKVNIYTQTEINIINNVKKHRNEKIDVSDWKEYKVGDIFDIKGTKRVISKDLEKIDEKEKFKPYITRKSGNNGCENFYKYKSTESKNAITIGTQNALAYYQNTDFITGADVRCLRLKNTFRKNLNEEIGLFICSLLNKVLPEKFGYGYECNSEEISESVILLPSIIHDDGTFEPDWDYMENYIKRLKTGCE